MLRIKEAREARGWTQEQLAAEMNTTQQTIQRWESGQTDPKSSAIKEISRLLGATVSFIMNVNDEDCEVDTDSSSLTANERSLVNLYRSVGSRYQENILNFVNGIFEIHNGNQNNLVKTMRALSAIEAMIFRDIERSDRGEDSR